MRIKRFLIFMGVAALFAGAGCKKILDQPVQGSYTPGNFFTSDANAQQAVNEAYKFLSFNAGANNAIWVLGDLASDDAIKGGGSIGDQQDFQAVSQFNILTSNSAVEAVWKNYYNGVFACNVVLDGLTGNNKVSPSMQASGIAQAKFLRAYYYFILTTCYGNIPLHLKVETAKEAQTPARPQDSVFAQIEQDCMGAAAALPATAPSLGMATKGAALALLAKTYLFHSDLANHYQLAAQTAEQVEGMGYQLTHLYSDNFSAATKDNTEEIFTVNHLSGTLGIGNELNVWFAPRPPAPTNGYGFFLPTQNLVDNYESAPGGEADPRLDYSIARAGHSYFDLPYDPTWSSTGYNTKKMVQPLSEVPAATKNVGTVNYEALRLGEILLIDAEALNESGQPAAALIPLNKVRARARNSYQYDNSLAGYPSVPAGLLPDVTTTDQTQLRDIIRRERRSELALEFHRFFDIIRYGKAYANSVLQPIAPNFNYDTNKWFPIPQSERDANPNLFK
ncbi:MAG TPA: RagB/SusD family nutrient uptake outer membrane protein [Puia sp.]|uniref:RagB/SusD family nutrient uptake outer membrane protein n=1 Tax=Puia sp. TaxID=2045100 RepID=UPI002C274122|nr:RagB/SusD family nutrient uptake outer membrane protein [Puia sp.]HVU95326.1 RagB/SusD family nutrient uptake outer membrane protein [Puia sp.]